MSGIVHTVDNVRPQPRIIPGRILTSFLPVVPRLVNWRFTFSKNNGIFNTSEILKSATGVGTAAAIASLALVALFVASVNFFVASAISFIPAAVPF